MTSLYLKQFIKKNALKTNKTPIDMRTTMNQSNVYNQHTLSCIY